MNVSMDGLRRSLSTVYNAVASQVNKLEVGTIINENELTQLRDDLTQLRQYIGFLNCIYDNDEDNFSNMSDQHLDVVVGNQD